IEKPVTALGERLSRDVALAKTYFIIMYFQVLAVRIINVTRRKTWNVQGRVRGINKPVSPIHEDGRNSIGIVIDKISVHCRQDGGTGRYTKFDPIRNSDCRYAGIAKGSICSGISSHSGEVALGNVDNNVEVAISNVDIGAKHNVASRVQIKVSRKAVVR